MLRNLVRLSKSWFCFHFEILTESMNLLKISGRELSMGIHEIKNAV